MNKQLILEHIQRADEEDDQETSSQNIPSADTLKSSTDTTEPESIIVESTLVHQSNEEHQIPIRPAPRKFFPLWLSFIFILIACIPSGIVLFIIPLLLPTATITIVPKQSLISTDVRLKMINGISNLAKKEISVRTLPALTIGESKEVATTGIGHQNAAQATGYITFYNASPLSQTISSGELLIGTDEMHIVTLQNAFIPAANPPLEGVSTVVAQAIVYGPEGNISAGDIKSECCREYIYVRNNQAFHGGANARSFPMVTKTDIDNAHSTLEASVHQHMLEVFKSELSSSEALVASPNCSSIITKSHDIGDEAASVSIGFTEKCRAQGYNKADLLKVSPSLLSQIAGPGYIPVQKTFPEVTILGAKTGQITVRLTEQFVYHFTQMQLRTFSRLIAGKSMTEARNLLFHIEGVEQASIRVTGAILPTDATRIHFDLQ